MRRIMRWAVGASLWTGCDSPTPPLVPAAIESFPAPAAIAVAGSVASPSPGIRVTTSDGRAVPDVVVTFAVAAGGGSAAGTTQTTDATGTATVGSWTLGFKAGANKLVAAAAGLSVEFFVDGVAGPPAKLVVETPPSSSVPNGVAFPTQPALRVLDGNDNQAMVAGVAVTASIGIGGGSLTGVTTAQTSTNGIAIFVDLAINGAAGQRTLSFTASGLTGAAASVTTTAGGASAVAVHAGAGQVATVGSAVAVAPAVRVVDADGNPVAGVSVSFSVSAGGGSVAGSPATTNTDGIAAVQSWTLGTVAGTNTLTATAPIGAPLTFTATGQPGSPTTLALTTPPSSSAQNRMVFATQPTLQLRDTHGNAVASAGVVVTATISAGGGTLLGSTTRTTANAGAATFNDLAIGGNVGERTLAFSAPNLTSAGATVVTTPGAASAIAIHAGDAQTSVVRTAVSVPPAVRVTDQDGNGVAGVAVSFAPTAGGGSVSNANATTNAGGVAVVGGWTLGGSVGANTLAATASGLSGSPVSVGATAGTIEFVPIITTGLSLPTLAISPPNDSRLFILEQQGRIRVYKNGALLATPYLDISARLRCCGEQGLLGLAFHPDFHTNGYFYVKYSTTNGDTNRVERYHATPTADVADAASATEIMAIFQPQQNHNGGMLLFGPDRKLWIATGDGGGGGDQDNLAQPLTTPYGKMLRIDVDAGTPYAIPQDNPYASGAGGARPEIWARGLRNPWRFTIDAVTGLLYIADVGQDAWEEVSVTPSTRSDVNYGWRIMEGAHCFNPSSCSSAGLELPVVEYHHTFGCSITGGFVYRGTLLPGLAGHYFYADFCVGFLRSFLFAGGSATDQREWAPGSVGNVMSFGMDSSGELYVLAGDGKVYQLRLRTS